MQEREKVLEIHHTAADLLDMLLRYDKSYNTQIRLLTTRGLARKLRGLCATTNRLQARLFAEEEKQNEQNCYQ